MGNELFEKKLVKMKAVGEGERSISTKISDTLNLSTAPYLPFKFNLHLKVAEQSYKI